MTEERPGPEGLVERDGTSEDVDVSRYYYDTADRTRAWVDWDGRILVTEAVAIKKTCDGMTPRQFSDGVNELDPEALRALVWMLRKFRGADQDHEPEPALRLLQVNLDISSVRVLNLDTERRRVVVPAPPPPDPQLVEDVTATLLGALPGLDPKLAARFAELLVDAADPEGEAAAGDEPAAGNGSSPTT